MLSSYGHHTWILRAMNMLQYLGTVSGCKSRLAPHSADAGGNHTVSSTERLARCARLLILLYSFKDEDEDEVVRRSTTTNDIDPWRALASIFCPFAYASKNNTRTAFALPRNSHRCIRFPVRFRGPHGARASHYGRAVPTSPNLRDLIRSQQKLHHRSSSC